MPPKKGGALKGQVIVISGTMSQPRKQMEQQISAHGGESGSSVTAKTTLLVTTPAEFATVTTKVAQAKGRDLIIVGESYLDACMQQGSLLDPTPFLLGGAPKGTKRKASAPAAPPAKAAKASSAAPVSPIATATLGKVTVHGGFSADLLQQEPAKNVDKYYKLQVLTKGGKFWCLQHWGRTGTSGQNKLDGMFANAGGATDIFTAKFKEKTGQEWGQYTAQKPGKYAMLVVSGNRGPVAKWQYYLHNSVDGKKIGWHDYANEAMQEMEDLWHTFQANQWLGTRWVESGTWTYEIDLPNMSQTNVKTNMTRGIRRVPKGTKPSSAPPPGY